MLNRLSYMVTDDDQKWFTLLVDGTPLGELLRANDDSIPYWMLSDGLPRASGLDAELFIVGICGCGVEGCSDVWCRIVREGNEVVFRDFDGDIPGAFVECEFRFDAVAFHQTMAELKAEARTECEKREASGR